MAKSGMADIYKLLATPEPPELGPGPREGVLPQAELNHALEKSLGPVQNQAQQLIRALLLLWHDHLDTAHEIAQDIDNADGAIVHGIMHRREPDYGNAKYWFRRTGAHAVYPLLAQRLNDLPKSPASTSLREKLAPNAQWDAFAFVDACERAARGGAGEQTRLLREVQRLETECLLDYFSK